MDASVAVSDLPHWLKELGRPHATLPSGLISVHSESPTLASEERVLLERARAYGADYVFFQAGGVVRSQPIALVFVNDSRSSDDFAELHRRLWSWGAVPLVFRKVMGRVDLLRCAHKPDFESPTGQRQYSPFRTLELAADISAQLAAEPWWDAIRLQTGALWNENRVTAALLHQTKAAHVSLIKAIECLDTAIQYLELPDGLARRLLIMSLLVGYLEDRGVLEPDVFDGRPSQPGGTATRFFDVLADGDPVAVVQVIDRLAHKFNGDVFHLEPRHRELIHTVDLTPFAKLVGGRESPDGQLSLWRRYTFADLPAELISRIYELFIDDAGAVYTPPFLAHVLVSELLSSERCERILAQNEVVLDPACGSGVFLVEAYKRLILHWRERHAWVKPDVSTLRQLLRHVHGVDKDAIAVELSAFSLCIALCDALDADLVRSSHHLFPSLQTTQLHATCFFEWLDAQERPTLGVVLGNPPFKSALDSKGARSHALQFEVEVGTRVPDKQLAYLFLERCLSVLAPGGALGMLQPHGILYNDKARRIRGHLFAKWDLREVIDLVRITGLFHGVKTRVVCLLFEGQTPPPDRRILHITPARTGRVETKQGLDIDYYDLHWLGRSDDLTDPVTWRAGLMGGRRALAFAKRLRKYPSLLTFTSRHGWPSPKEGYIKGKRGIDRGKADFLRGRDLVSPSHISNGMLDGPLDKVTDWPIEEPRAKENFTAPLLLIREHHTLDYAFLESGFYAYKDEIVGIPAPEADRERLRALADWFGENSDVLRAFAYIVCSRLFNRRWTSLAYRTIRSLPIPDDYDFALSDNERLVVQDILGPYSQLARLESKKAPPLQCVDDDLLEEFGAIYARQVSSLFPGLTAHSAYRSSGMVCQPFSFGNFPKDALYKDVLPAHLHQLLHDTLTSRMHLRRIVRIYDGQFILLLKPDVQRFWLRSTALRDADETVADLTSRTEC